MREFRAWIILILVPAVLIALFFWLAPQRHNPLAPIDLTEEPGFGTWHKLTRAKKHSEVCFNALDDAGVLYTPLENSPKSDKCGLYNALSLGQSYTPFSAPLRMTCAQTAALYTWERHIVAPAATKFLGSPVERIETYGSFSCRNVAGTGRASEHAGANAIDVSGFRLKDGRLIDVKKHWRAGGKEAKFLRKVHKGGCKLFSVTLGPDYNAAHADHFHMDMGSSRACH